MRLEERAGGCAPRPPSRPSVARGPVLIYHPRVSRPLLLVSAALVATFATSSRTIAGEPPDAEPLHMAADKLDLDVEAKTATLDGHVKLSRGGMTVGCPHVEVRYDEVPNVRWAKGTGGVVAEVKGVRAEAKEVEIDFAARALSLHGGVKITRGEGWISAEKASINLATARVSMTDVKGSFPLPKSAP
jgi:lipopolysaccharide export system protein LptA